MATEKTDAAKKMFATRDFTDAGTGKSFVSGAAVEADGGEIANYAAAGLVGPEQAKADKPAG